MTEYKQKLFSDHRIFIADDLYNAKQKEKSSTYYIPAQFGEVNHLCQNLDSLDMSGVQSCSQYRHDVRETIFKQAFSQDEDGDTVLHSSVIVLNENIAKHLINVAPSFQFLNIANHLRQTPLHLAILTNQVHIVRRLIVGGADIMSRDRDGNTALHVACREGFVEIVRTLLEPVRYVEIKQNKYDIPYQRIPQDLRKTNFDGYSCLHIAALNKHLEIVKILLEKFADINCKDIKSGRTPLHHACVDGNVELVQLLLSYKSCNINARTYDSLTPFDLARGCGHARITFELAAAGARAADEIDMEDI